MIEASELVHCLQEQLFSPATHKAAEAMRLWTNGEIQLTLDDVRSIPLESIADGTEFGFELLTMVVLTLQNEFSGQLILTFDDANGRQLAATLLNRPLNTETEWTELEESALNETGNILGCAYVNVLTELIDEELIPSPPQLIRDYGESVLGQAVMSQAMDDENVVFCKTRFEREQQSLDWNLLFVPGKELLDCITQAVRVTSST